MLAKCTYILLFISLLSMVACGRHSQADKKIFHDSESSDKKIFRYNESSGITSLDPLKATNLSNIWAVQQIYEGLTMIDSNGLVQPCLATSWTVQDSMRIYKFTLRKDVFFHDDSCFNGKKRKLEAFDITYSFRRIASSSKWMLDNLETVPNSSDPIIIMPDSFHVVFTLKKPSSTFLQMLAMPQCGIVAREAVEMYGTDFGKHPVGTGPFKFQVWHENEKLILHKNPNYRQKGIPLIDGIAISFLKDKQTALLEFIRGKFDFISGIDAAYKDELLMGDGTLNPKYADKILLRKNPYLNTEYLGIRLDSTSNSPLQNIHIRKALNYALDRAKLIQYIRNGIGIEGVNGMVPPVLFKNGLKTKGYGYDKKKFEEEIKAAGYLSANAVPSFKLSADVAYTDVCTFIINQWNELGLHVTLDILDRPTLKSEVAKGNIEFFRASWIADYPDPENYLSLFYGPLESPAGPNYTHFKNKRYDMIYELNGSQKNDSIRNMEFSNLDQLVMDQSPVIILYYDQAVRFINKRVKHLPPHPMNYLDLRNVDLN